MEYTAFGEKNRRRFLTPGGPNFKQLSKPVTEMHCHVKPYPQPIFRTICTFMDS